MGREIRHFKDWHRCKNNTEVSVKAIGQKSVIWIDLAYDREVQRAFLNTVMNIRFPQTQKLPECQLIEDFLPSLFCLLYKDSVRYGVSKLSLVNMIWEGLGRKRSHRISRYNYMEQSPHYDAEISSTIQDFFFTFNRIPRFITTYLFGVPLFQATSSYLSIYDTF